jgi:adenosine deaminase CECR1
MIAMVEFDHLFAVLLAEPGIHIIAPDTPLATDTARATAAIEFRFQRSERRDANIWDSDYIPGTPVLLSQAADQFPGDEGGSRAFLRWLKSRSIISPEDALEHHYGVDEIWAKFQGCFAVVSTIIHYEPIFRAFLRRLMNLLKADGINWAEIR